MPEALLLLSTCPDEASASRIARALVEERLAACVNRIAGVVSVYRWRCEVREEGETLLLIKTTRGKLEALQARVLALHPYETPELIVLDISWGYPPYLQWLSEQV